MDSAAILIETGVNDSVRCSLTNSSCSPTLMLYARWRVQEREISELSASLRAHALADISSPSSPMPEGTATSSLQSHAQAHQGQQHSSDTSAMGDTSPDASVLGRSATAQGNKVSDAEDSSAGSSYASIPHGEIWLAICSSSCDLNISCAGRLTSACESPYVHSYSANSRIRHSWAW